MADSDTLVIRAELLSDIPEKAALDAAAVKSMTEAVKSGSGDMGTAVGQLGERLDTVHQRTQQAATGGSKLKKAYDDLYESGGKLREQVSSLGESIEYRLRYPMQQLTYMMEGAAAGMVTFGLVTGSSLQQGALALGNLTGSATVAASAMAQLRQMQGAVGLTQLEGGYSSLFQAGMAPGQVMSTLRGLSGISAVSGNPNQTMPALAQAVASMTSTGLLTTSDVQAFSGSNVDIWGMLARETGQTPAQLRLRFLRAGTPMAVPGQLMGDLMSSPGATGGNAAYDKTWAGQLDKTKKAAGDLLAVIETPLGNALAGAGQKIDTWAQGTEQRFKQLGGSLGAEWKSGNMGGFSSTLADVLGDPKMAGGIDTVATSLHGLGNIIEHSLIPMGHDILTVAAPALHELGATLDFLGQHRTTTEALIGMFGGFLIVSKVARSFSAATMAIRDFSTIMEAQGAIAAIGQWERGLLGLSTAQQAVAMTAGEEATAEGVASGTAGLGGMGAMGGLAGKAGMVGLGLGGAYMGYQGMTSKSLTLGSGLETVGGDAAAGAMIGNLIPIPGVGAGIGALAGGMFGLGDVGMRLLGGAVHHHTTHVAQINVTVPGAGNPQKVANAVPKAINAQIVAQQQRSVRRGG